MRLALVQAYYWIGGLTQAMSSRDKAPIYDISSRLPTSGAVRKPAAPVTPPRGDDASAVKKYARMIQSVLTPKEIRLVSLLGEGCSIDDLRNALGMDPDALRNM